MPEIEGLKVTMTADLADYLDKMRQMESRTAQAGQNVSGSMSSMANSARQSTGVMSSFFDALGTTARYAGAAAAIYGVTNAMQSAVKSGMDFNSMLEQNTIAFGSLLKSGEAGEQMIRDLWKLAEQTPYTMQDVTAGAKKMLAFGFDKSEIIDVLKTVGDASSALGMSGSEGIGRITLALGQMKAKTKVSGDEMRQLTEAGIPGWDMLAKAMSKTTAEVMDLSEKGMIPADQAIRVLLEGMNERFGGMMEKQSKTFSGQMSTLGDAVSSTMGLIVKPAFDVLATSTIPAVIEKVSLLRDVLSAGGYEGAVKSIIPAEAVDGIKAVAGYLATISSGTAGLEKQFSAIGSSVQFAKDHLTDFAALFIAGGAIAYAPQILTGITLAFEGLQLAAMGTAIGTGAALAGIVALINPVTLVAAALIGLTYIAAGWADDYTEYCNKANDGSQTFLDGTVVMSDGSRSAMTSAAAAANDLADEVVSASSRAYAAVMTMWEAFAEARSVEKSDMDYGSRHKKDFKAPSSSAGITLQPGSRGGGGGGGGSHQTELEKYKKDTQDLINIWSKQVELEQLSRTDFAKNVSARLNGLAAINAQEKELLAKQEYEMDLTSKIAAINREARSEEQQFAKSKMKLGEVTLDQYKQILLAQAEQKMSDKDRLALMVELSNVADQEANRKIIAYNRVKDMAASQLAMDDENNRHSLALAKITATSGYNEKMALLQQESVNKKAFLDQDYQNEKKMLEQRLRLKAENKQTDTEEYRNLLNEKAKLDEEYNLKVLQNKNDLSERITELDQENVSAWRSNLSALIKGTESAHDILKKQWFEFIDAIVEKAFNINGESNLFKAILGPMFGLVSKTPTSSKLEFTGDSGEDIFRASGGPVSSGQAYIVGERGPEMFVPSSFGSIIPNNRLPVASGSPNVSVNVVNNTGVQAQPRVNISSTTPSEYIVSVFLDAWERDSGGLRTNMMGRA